MDQPFLPEHAIAALSGNNAPVDDEIVATDLPVIGEIPKDLNGIYVRNGPNPHFAPAWRYHAYDGDGMLHSLTFDHGRATYRNRWIRTAALNEEMQAGHTLWQGLKEKPRAERPDMPLKDTSNTDVKFHNGRLVTMWYLSGQPYHVDIHTLETIGPADLGGVTRLSAHSRPDEHTGELMFFDYGKTPPYMTYGVVGPDGKLKTRTEIPLPGPRLPHDMAITEHFSILHDFPLFIGEEARREGRHKLAFHPEVPSRFAVIPRHGGANDIQWFEASPGFLLHVVNAWEEGDDIVMIGTPYRVHRDAQGGLDGDRLLRTIHKRQRDFVLQSWRFNRRTGKTTEEVIDDVLNSEFPVINTAYQGRKNRYSYNVVFPHGGDEEPRFPGLVKYNLDTGGYRAFSDGPHVFYNEPGFAPRDNANAEDDGYLVTFVWLPREMRSEVQIFRAEDAEFARGPIARIILPRRVPNGFHATYVSAARLATGR